MFKFFNFLLTKKKKKGGVKRFTHRGQQGMMLVEIILIAVFLATVAIGTSYFFAQTKVTMSSSSQVMQCSTIAKQALENVVSLGARLYGYRINYHTNSAFSYKPLFIKDDGGGVVKDVGSGSELSFPPEMYKTLYTNLGVSPSVENPQSNTGKPLIGDSYPYDISTAVLIVNSVNALQYLYNSDNGFNSGKGKMHTAGGSGDMSKLLKKYKDQFDLAGMKFYIKVTPINLQTEEEVASPPSQILTRPRFHNPQDAQLSPALTVLGDTEVGFEIKVTLEYERDGQEYTCDASHRFAHQIKPIAKRSQSIFVEEVSLESGAGIDLKTIPPPGELTSCDTDGGGFDEITVTIDFNNFYGGIKSSEQIGTIVLCQMNSYCRSYGNASYNGCNPQLGRWQRCHDIQPTDPDQNWTYTPELTSDQVLAMKFATMKEDRRYELNVGEFSMAGHNLRNKMVSKFYIDAKRPIISGKNITNNAVGAPGDGGGGGNYDGPFTNWIKPGGSINKWLQCNQDTVEFSADIEDQFTHNLKKCELKGEREDGNGKAATSPTLTSDCGGSLSGVQQGRQTITFTPKDTCGGTNTEDLVWDTDLPIKFEAHDFPSDPEWFKSTDKDAYPIKTVLPAKDTAGEFPKHYSVDCNDNFMGSKVRKDGNDGNGGQLDCELEGSKPYHDDGCNPIQLSTKYYHVCGGAEVCKGIEWGVYVPHKPTCTGPSCKCTNVQCEPQLICCDGFRNECGNVGTEECETNSYPTSCSDPKGGGRTQQDSASGCPPLGLYDCSYTLPCEATTPFATTGPSSECIGKRQGQYCDFSLSGTCIPYAGAGVHENSPSTAGWCQIRGQNANVACSASLSSFCDFGHWETQNYSCNCQTTCSGVPPVCSTTCGTCSRQVWECDDTDYTLSNGSCSRLFTGACGVPSGGCPKLGVGGGNLSQERCDARPASCALQPGVVTPPCDPNVECCGGTYPSNLNCPSDCVKANGKACCLVSEGGDCTGQFCATNCANSGTCHVREINDDGVCRPTCGNLAEARGYTGDGASDTSNWTHTTSTCTSLNTQELWGSDNWIKIPLIDNKEPQEVIEHGGECCGRPPSACDSSKECCDLDKHSDLGGSNNNCLVNGECDTPNDDCKYGDKEDATPPDVTWICKGKNEGDDSEACGTCDPAVKCCDGQDYSTNPTHCPLDGECSPTGCAAGDPDPDPPDLTKTRTCKGENKGEDATCPPGVTKVNAICSPTGCSEGKIVKHNDGTWTCKGENEGDDAPQTPCPINGVCSDTGCAAGTQDPANPNLSLSSTGSWICKGIGTGSPSNCCPRNGVCSDTGCAVGTKQEPSPPDGTWICKGICKGGNSGTCGVLPTNGVCSDTGCAVGTKDPPNAPPGTWICKGLNGGGDSGTCGEPTTPCASPPVDGVCSDTGCDAGTRNPPSGGTTWICEDIAGEILKNGTCTQTNGNDSSDCGGGECSGDPPVDGACSDTGCSAGTPNPSSPDPNGTWTCEDIAGEVKTNGTCTQTSGNDRNCGCGVSKTCCPDGTDGVCSDTGCSAGDPDPDPPPNHGIWICKGTNSKSGCTAGRDSPTCSGCPDGTDGVCSDTGCSAGDKQETSPVDGTWVCKGTNSKSGCTAGRDSPTCGCNTNTECCGRACGSPNCKACPVPIPACGGYVHGTGGTCDGNGNVNVITDTSLMYEWECKAGGKTVGCLPHNKCSCSLCPQPPPAECCNSGAECCPNDDHNSNPTYCIPPSVDGVCDIPNHDCKKGPKNTINANKWECLGEHGGQKATCQIIDTCDSTVECCPDDTHTNLHCPCPGRLQRSRDHPHPCLELRARCDLLRGECGACVPGNGRNDHGGAQVCYSISGSDSTLWCTWECSGVADKDGIAIHARCSSYYDEDDPCPLFNR